MPLFCRPRSPRMSGLIMLMLGVIVVASPRSAPAESPPTGWKLELSVPEKHPTGLVTVLSGKLRAATKGDVPDSDDLPAVIGLSVPGASSAVPAQYDSRSGFYLALLEVRPEWRGRTVTLPADDNVGKAARTVRIESTEGGYRFLDAGRAVMFYQQTPRSLEGRSTRANYVHPVHGLNGEVLTQDFPSDHIHHRGVFWAWHQLWVGDRRAGDAWANSDFLTIVRSAEVTDQGPVFATLKINADWTSPLVKTEDNPEGAFVTETTTLRVYHRGKDSQFIDFTISLRGLLDDVRIGGSEDRKGYSGFTVRVAPPEAMQIADENGVLKKDGMHNRSRWADVSGKFGSEDKQSGLAILSHAGLPEFPPKWLLRHYGMQNVLWPGREPVELSRKKPLTLRHRLMIHTGGAEGSRLPDQQTWYANLP